MAAQLVRTGRRDQRGMTTAEYAVGTVATVSLVGGIISILNNEQFRGFLWELIKALLQLVINAITGS